jgi:hypothetical protein
MPNILWALSEGILLKILIGMNCILLDSRKFHFPVPASLLELAIKKLNRRMPILYFPATTSFKKMLLNFTKSFRTCLDINY